MREGGRRNKIIRQKKNEKRMAVKKQGEEECSLAEYGMLNEAGLDLKAIDGEKLFR